jgi:hypothetical protein
MIRQSLYGLAAALMTFSAFASTILVMGAQSGGVGIA